MERPGGGAMSNVVHYLRDIDLPAAKDELVHYARSKDAPRSVLEQLNKLVHRSYKTITDLTSQLGKALEKERPPIENYDAKSAREILEEMNSLGRQEVRRVKEYEENNAQRKTILQKAEHMLEPKKEPVDAYNELNAKDLTKKINRMAPGKLRQLKSYEREHKNRKTVIEAIERKLKQKGER